MSSPQIIESFSPSFTFRHADVQNIVSSVGPRVFKLRRNNADFFNRAENIVIDCGEVDTGNIDKHNQVRLSGAYHTNPENKGLLITFHGWEGSIDSPYVVSLAATFYNAGYNIFRLNFRDHGDSHHLNEGLFNSTLLPEVLAGVGKIQSLYPSDKTVLAGFSLGGNFALRTAMSATKSILNLHHVFAVCPVIDPAHAMQALENGKFIYHDYFVRKWRKSLLKKQASRTEYNYAEELNQLKSLRDYHNFFIPRFTPYNTIHDYFSAYQINNDELAELAIPTTIINSQDDPITRADALPSTSPSKYLDIHLTKYGSHCAFIENLSLTSWVDRHILDIVSQ